MPEPVRTDSVEKTRLSGSIFISYRKCDGAAASAIAEALENQGFRAWYYERDMPKVADYKAEVAQQIAKSGLFVILFSHESMKGNQKQVLAECGIAFRRDVPRLVVLHDMTHAEWEERNEQFEYALIGWNSHSVCMDSLRADCEQIAAGIAQQYLPGPHDLGEPPPKPRTADKPPFEPVWRLAMWAAGVFVTGILTAFAAYIVNWATQPSPVAACCFDSAGECRDLSKSECAQAGGRYLGDDSTCTGNPCYRNPPPFLAATGACCLPNGGCVVDVAAECEARGGQFQGRGVACNDVRCLKRDQSVNNSHNENDNSGNAQDNPHDATRPTSPSLGACCFDDGRPCAELPQNNCEQQGGLYQGDKTDCSRIACPAPALGACCLPECICEIMSKQDCAKRAGSYQGDDSRCTQDLCLPALTNIAEGASCLALIFIENQHNQNIAVQLTAPITSKLSEIGCRASVEDIQGAAPSILAAQRQARCRGVNVVIVFSVQLLKNGEVRGMRQSKYILTANAYESDGTSWKAIAIETNEVTRTLNAVKPGSDPPTEEMVDQFKYLVDRTMKAVVARVRR